MKFWNYEKRQSANGSVNKEAASKVSDTIRQIIRGTKEKREKKDKEMEAACLISSANGGNINTVVPSATKSSNTTSAAVTPISALPLLTQSKLFTL